MPVINNQNEFISELAKFVGIGNIIHTFSNDKIIIDEKSEEGSGEVYLDISTYNGSSVFFVKINHWSSHNIGSFNQHNDGIVLKVNLLEREVEVSLFELKKQLRFNKLEKATAQLVNAYRLIKYLQLEECFSVKYKFFVAYQDNNLHFDSDSLKTMSEYQIKLFNAVYKNMNTIPLFIPMCEYKVYDFEQVVFGASIAI